MPLLHSIAPTFGTVGSFVFCTPATFTTDCVAHTTLHTLNFQTGAGHTATPQRRCSPRFHSHHRDALTDHPQDNAARTVHVQSRQQHPPHHLPPHANAALFCGHAFNMTIYLALPAWFLRPWHRKVCGAGLLYANHRHLPLPNLGGHSCVCMPPATTVPPAPGCLRLHPLPTTTVGRTAGWDMLPPAPTAPPPLPGLNKLFTHCRASHRPPSAIVRRSFIPSMPAAAAPPSSAQPNHDR